jgi:protoheme IX farnesyltransferase
MTTATLTLNTASIRDYITLLKPRVMSLVVFCGAIGMILAPGQLHPLLQAIAVLCIALATGASGALNMWYDRDMDAIMKRTQNRPIPAGRIAPDDALTFGVLLASFSVMLMGLALNWVAAGVLSLAIAIYVGIYTLWLKRRSVQNIVIGGASGALPPVIGWAAVTGNVTLEPLILFAIIFLWTPAHFWALALYRHEDYAKAGVPMLPVVAGTRSTKGHILAYTLLVVASSLLPYAIGMLGLVYATVAALLGVMFVLGAVRMMRGGKKEAMALFVFSMFYLFILFAAMPIDRWLGL